MKNSRGFIQIIIIILVVLALAAGVYYFGTKNKVVVAPIASTQPSLSPIAESTPNPSPTEISVQNDRLQLTQYLIKQYYDQGKQYGKIQDQVIINISKFDGNYAMGTGGFTTGGSDVWFATKVNGNWFLIQQTQEPPDCKLMTQYNFPKSIYGECI